MLQSGTFHHQLLTCITVLGIWYVLVCEIFSQSPVQCRH